MLGKHPLSLKEADLVLCRDFGYYKEVGALATVDISCVDVSLSYAVVAGYTRLEQHELCHKYTW